MGKMITGLTAFIYRHDCRQTSEFRPVSVATESQAREKGAGSAPRRCARPEFRQERKRDQCIGIAGAHPSLKKVALPVGTHTRHGINNPSGKPKTEHGRSGSFLARRRAIRRGDSMPVNASASDVCCIFVRPVCCPWATVESNRKCGVLGAGIGPVKPAGLVPKRSLGEKYATHSFISDLNFSLQVVVRIGYVHHYWFHPQATVNCC
jgi:hypothetical protein